MKKFCIWFLLIFALLGCVPELPVQPEVLDEGYPEGAKVTVRFSVSKDGFAPTTKALSEAPELDSLYLAVFGSSGYLKEYVKAQIAHSHSYQPDDTIIFSAALTLSDKPRTIHFIGNGPSTLDFGYASDILPPLLSENGGQAYWQMKEDVIIAGDKQNDGTYKATEATKAQFQNISLVRNFAKIVLSAAPDTVSNFTPISFAVFNVPSKGSVVPYDKDFIKNYQNYGFSGLADTLQYPGNLPDSTDFVGVPDEWETRKVPVSNAVYMYERPVPTEQALPSYVIVYGYYYNVEDTIHKGNYYYKIDLAQGGSYYPIYRNFKYQIRINRILSRGHETVLAAAASAGSADVSSDITTSHLNDISDGEARLVVQPWMSYAFTKRQVNNKMLNVKFFSDAMSENPDMAYSSVYCEKRPMADGGEDVLENVSIGYPVQGTGTDKGWRTITFSTKEPGAPGTAARTQVLRVYGKYETETHETRYLYRDVRITLQPLQQMQLRVVNPDDEEKLIPRARSKKVQLKISVPAGLNETIFPLDFTIEPEDMSLTPDTQVSNNNLPVSANLSISDHAGYAGKRAFQFHRTLTYAEYLTLTPSLDLDGEPVRTLTCYFVTTRKDNATTIWVANEYFSKAHVTYTNSDFSYFFIEPRAACTVSSTKAMKYAIDSDESWTEYTPGTSNDVSLDAGERMYIVSTVKDWSDKPFTVSGNVAFAIGGNLASLIEGEDYKQNGASATGWSFKNFMNGTKVVDASELELPMLTVPVSGYEAMFSDCKSLSEPPSSLPADSLKHHAYYQMFFKCTELSSAPAFPHDNNGTYVIEGDSTCYQMFFQCAFTQLTGQLYNASAKLSTACFQDMFSECKSLATIPDNYLPATTLAKDCYRGMFQSTAITKAPELLVETLSSNWSNCYRYMFYGCKSLSYIKCLATNPSASYTTNFTGGGVAAAGTFVKKSNVTWPRGANGIPNGWDIVEF